MLNAMRATALTVALVVAGQLGWTSEAAAVEVDIEGTFGATSVTVTIGLARVSALDPFAPTVCVNDSTTFNMRNGGGTGSLNDEVLIIAGAGANDSFRFVRSGVAVPTDRDCGRLWAPLNFNGFFVEVDGGNGFNNFEGPTGAEDYRFQGGTDVDYMYVFGTTGDLLGRGGDDDFRSIVTTSSSEEYSGSSGSDCIQDASNSRLSLSCGVDSDFHNFSSAPADCENFIANICCGLC